MDFDARWQESEATHDTLVRIESKHFKVKEWERKQEGQVNEPRL